MSLESTSSNEYTNSVSSGDFPFSSSVLLKQGSTEFNIQEEGDEEGIEDAELETLPIDFAKLGVIQGANGQLHLTDSD